MILYYATAEQILDDAEEASWRLLGTVPCLHCGVPVVAEYDWHSTSLTVQDLPHWFGDCGVGTLVRPAGA